MLEEIKVLLGINTTDKDIALQIIIKNISNRLKLRLGLDEVPSDLEFIVIEMVIVRFNRIGSEGFSSESTDGVSVSYNTSDLFSEYDAIIDDWLVKNTDDDVGDYPVMVGG